MKFLRLAYLSSLDYCSVFGSSVRKTLLREVSSVHLTQPNRLAGHSHWQNVRHTKEAQDKIKSANAQYYQRAVYTAIKLGRGVRDPKLNTYLANVLAEAKANSVPFSSLERVLKADHTTDPYIVEVQAQGGLFILIETCAKPVSTERQKIASIVKKYGCSVSPAAGRIVKEFFDYIGLVCVNGGPATNIPNLDTATNLGIEIGATEVEECTANDRIMYKFYCDPVDLQKLRQSLEEHKIPILSMEDTYIPKNHVLVPSQAYANLDNMYERIRQYHEHVDRIFDNATVTSDSQ